jgi:hypothetical protein
MEVHIVRGKKFVIIKAGGSDDSSQLSAQEAGNLEITLILSIGTKVRVTRNIAPWYGITNGAIGYVVDIIYPAGTVLNAAGSNNMPVTVLVRIEGLNLPEHLRVVENAADIVALTPFSHEQG